MIDGIINPEINGWAIWNAQTNQTQSETALLTIANPIPAGPETWTITIYQDYLGGGGGAHLLGDFSLGYTTDPSPTLSSHFTPFTVTAATTLNGSTLTSLGSGQVLDNGLLPLTDVYTITLTSDSPDPITGIFLDAIKDPTNGLPDGGPGRWYGNSGTEINPSGVGLGNFVVSELTAGVSPGPPYMYDVISNHSVATLSGRAEADSTVSVFDGKTLLGMATADSFGNWSLRSTITGHTVHDFTEILTDVAGNSVASAGVTVYSPSQHQTLAGGTGNDFLIAGLNDTLIGGTGSDTFVFNANFGNDAINNFNTNHDTLAFSHTLFANDTVAQVLSQTHDTSAGTVIAVDAHDSITLHGVTKAQLAAHPSDFHFF
jgi:hypothetical protein